MSAESDLLRIEEQAGCCLRFKPRHAFSPERSGIEAGVERDTRPAMFGKQREVVGWSINGKTRSGALKNLLVHQLKGLFPQCRWSSISLPCFLKPSKSIQEPSAVHLGLYPLAFVGLGRNAKYSVQVLVQWEHTMLTTALSTEITTLNAQCGIFAQGSCGRVLSEGVRQSDKHKLTNGVGPTI